MLFTYLCRNFAGPNANREDIPKQSHSPQDNLDEAPSVNCWDKLPELPVTSQSFNEVHRMQEHMVFGITTMEGVNKYFVDPKVEFYSPEHLRSLADVNKANDSRFLRSLGMCTVNYSDGAIQPEYPVYDDEEASQKQIKDNEVLAFLTQLKDSRYDPRKNAGVNLDVIRNHKRPTPNDKMVAAANRDNSVFRIAMSFAQNDQIGVERVRDAGKGMLEYILFNPGINKLHFILDGLPNLSASVKQPNGRVIKGLSNTDHQLRHLHRLALLYPDLVKEKVICWRNFKQVQLPARSVEPRGHDYQRWADYQPKLVNSKAGPHVKPKP